MASNLNANIDLDASSIALFCDQLKKSCFLAHKQIEL